MPKLIKLAEDGGAFWADDRFIDVADGEDAPRDDIIVSLKRFLAERESLKTGARAVGVRLGPDDEVEDLARDLPVLPVVALVFPKFRDGRAYSAATLLRERYGYEGEVRAVGDVLREQALFMARCGFDAFVPADGSTPEQWAAAVGRFRHVYQRAADRRAPAFEDRANTRAKHAV